MFFDPGLVDCRRECGFKRLTVPASVVQAPADPGRSPAPRPPPQALGGPPQRILPDRLAGFHRSHSNRITYLRASRGLSHSRPTRVLIAARSILSSVSDIPTLGTNPLH